MDLIKMLENEPKKLRINRFLVKMGDGLLNFNCFRANLTTLPFSHAPFFQPVGFVLNRPDLFWGYKIRTKKVYLSLTIKV